MKGLDGVFMYHYSRFNYAYNYIKTITYKITE